MQSRTSAYRTAISAAAREMRGRVKVYSGSSLVTTYTGNDSIQSIEIQRTGESGKFFGFAVSHKLVVTLLDRDREISIPDGRTMQAELGVVISGGSEEYNSFPTFYHPVLTRNENTNTLKVEAYDLLEEAKKHTVSELNLTPPYTVQQFATACATLLGTTTKNIGIGSGETCFSTSFPDGANYAGTENLRDALGHVAEVTQTVCFINYENKIVFKRMSSSSVTSITKDDYFTLKQGATHSLQTICSATELGDNVHESTVYAGDTQYVRNNPFWELRTDLSTLIHNAITAVGNAKRIEFDAKWRGNPATEVGDAVTLTAKDDSTFRAYVINSTLTYTGGLRETLKWEYSASNTETASNPTSLGDALNQTYARVDKANRRIEQVVSEVTTIRGDMDDLAETTSQQITEAVQTAQSLVFTALEEYVKTGDFETYKETVSASLAIMADNIEMQIRQVTTELSEVGGELQDQITEITKYFRFTADGLIIGKSGNEVLLRLDNDIISFLRNNMPSLWLDELGLNAENVVTNRIQIGNFEFTSNSDGSLTLRKAVSE